MSDHDTVSYQGLEKLLPYDVSGLRSMLNIISPGASYDRYPDQATQIDSVMKFKTSKDAFLWPRDNPSSAAPPRVSFGTFLFADNEISLADIYFKELDQMSIVGIW